MGTKPEQSGNKNPKVRQEWEQSEKKWEQEPQSEARMGTKWEQSGSKNPKVGNNVGKSGRKSANKVKKTWKWGKNGNKVDTKWEQEP